MSFSKNDSGPAKGAAPRTGGHAGIPEGKDG
jgi:hypothetical protein